MKFWIKGDSIADFFASADGGVFLVMTEGKLDVLLTELAGLDIGETLLVLTGGAETVPIDCVYIDMHAVQGNFELQTALVDTSDTLFLADGSIDFNREFVDLLIEPRPKDVSLLSLRSPINVEGPLSGPGIFPSTGSLLARGALAAALAAATPLAGLVPFIEPGSGEDSVYCSGLSEAIDRARRED